ncbi:hypothetical protein ANN_10291 [Periplaneta americana]|uniref:Uncharacterized protein n=1 Tax=Periplaneta americana TaxID=6978 RepID=A0ABQ8TRD6_PERAM|nr:hypothetical protein ANN_10291 [Periplaneta americana]
MADLCEGGNESAGSLKAICDNADEISPGSSTSSYPAFAYIGLRENPGKNLNRVTYPNRDSNPGHLVSRPTALTVTPQVWTRGSGSISDGSYGSGGSNSGGNSSGGSSGSRSSGDGSDNSSNSSSSN